jgi:hypothetical protein
MKVDTTFARTHSAWDSKVGGEAYSHDGDETFPKPKGNRGLRCWSVWRRPVSRWAGTDCSRSHDSSGELSIPKPGRRIREC